jgi:hypothetical protein
MPKPFENLTLSLGKQMFLPQIQDPVFGLQRVLELFEDVAWWKTS